MVFRLFSSIFALIFLAILFIIFSHFNAFAQNIANEQNILLNNQIQQSIEQERKNIIRQKEIEEIKKGHEKTFKPQEAEVKNKDELCLIENACRIIQDFEIKGASVYSSEKLYKKFAKKYRETCLTKFDLNDMNKAINQFYLENGFVLARVYFDLAKLVESGIVIIVIEEGKIDKITLRDNSKLNDFLPFRRSLQKNTAFFGISESDEYDDKSGDVFNLRDFEQGLDQINRLGSQNAKMQIEPAQKAGYSNIIIDNEIGDLATLSFTLDNSGNARSGRINF
jgi:hemolysin activation/secretion protein